MAIIKNPNLIEYSESFFDEQQGMLFIVMENIEFRDLQSRVKEAKYHQSFISEAVILDIFKKVLQALQEMHSTGVFHMSINLSNVFLSNDNQVKLGDFTQQLVFK